MKPDMPQSDPYHRCHISRSNGYMPFRRNAPETRIRNPFDRQAESGHWDEKLKGDHWADKRRGHSADNFEWARTSTVVS